MKFFAIAILLISAEGSYGVIRSGSTITSSNATLSNQTEESNAGRTKRYIEHFNPLFKHMDFLKKDECRPTLSGDRRFFCPTMNEANEWICVTLDQLCDTKANCPNSEDEDETMCLFHRHTLAKLDDIAARLEDIQHLFSQQVSSTLREHQMPRDRVSHEIQNRLKLEFSLRNSLEHYASDMVPSPELVKTREDASDKDNDASDEENEDYYSLADLPSKAQEMLMLGPYHKINLNLNPSHPFNHGNDVALRHAKAETKARNTKKHRIRRHARHPWNQS